MTIMTISLILMQIIVLIMIVLQEFKFEVLENKDNQQIINIHIQI